MTDEQMRVAIAERCGWTRVEYGPYDGYPFGIKPNETNPAYKLRVPDYPNDLNAMHEAEETLTDRDDKGECRAFVEELRAIHYKQVNLYPSTFGLIHAAARRRAEAFLRTVGKWKEDA